MDELFGMFDPDGSGLIDYSELHALLREESTRPHPRSSPWRAP